MYEIFKKKRIGIYVILDENGIIDNYNCVFLKAIRQCMTELYVVTVQEMEQSNRKKLLHFCDGIVTVPDFKTCSFYLYKKAIENIQYVEIEQFDELTLIDSSIMGPVNSFDDMFEEMEQKDVDAWGITKAYAENPDNDIKTEYIQGYFLNINKRMLIDDAFKAYWKRNFDKCEDYSEDFYNYIKECEFVFETYVSTDDIQNNSPDPLLFDTYELVCNRRCPVFYKKMFSWDYSEILDNSAGYRSRRFFDYLKESERYDVDIIWETILRTEHQEEIVRNLSLTYVVDEQCETERKENSTSPKIGNVALIMHLYYEDMIEGMLKYAENMPEDSDIYITVVNSVMHDKVLFLLKRISSLRQRTDIRIIQNRGRDISSLLIGVKDVVHKYDLVLFIHDKRTPQINKMCVGEDFGKICYENLIPTKDYVKNVIALFERNQRLGLLIPPFPSFGVLFILSGNEWGPNFENTLQLSHELGLHVPMALDKRAMAPYGTCFWFRPQALKKLFERDWEYADFPSEPNKIDGTILHAVERIYPYVVQDAGYYMGFIMSKLFAGVEYQKLDYYLDEYNKRLFRLFEINNFRSMLFMSDEYIKHEKSRNISREHIKSIDYIIKDWLHDNMTSGPFNRVINIKRKLFGPHEEYDSNRDKRYQ